MLKMLEYLYDGIIPLIIEWNYWKEHLLQLLHFIDKKIVLESWTSWNVKEFAWLSVAIWPTTV